VAIQRQTVEDGLMSPTYILFTRSGCCLCEGLEERLLELISPQALQLVDVDSHPALQSRYGLSVPVLALPSEDADDATEASPLPPVPPRLKGERVRAWLARYTS
jgi:hypothetical protein